MLPEIQVCSTGDRETRWNRLNFQHESTVEPTYVDRPTDDRASRDASIRFAVAVGGVDRPDVAVGRTGLAEKSLSNMVVGHFSWRIAGNKHVCRVRYVIFSCGAAG